MKEFARMNPSKDMNDALELFVRSIGLKQSEEQTEVPIEDLQLLEKEGDL
jgi:glutamyl-tRNA reductase